MNGTLVGWMIGVCVSGWLDGQMFVGQVDEGLDFLP